MGITSPASQRGDHSTNHRKRKRKRKRKHKRPSPFSTLTTAMGGGKRRSTGKNTAAAVFVGAGLLDDWAPGRKGRPIPAERKGKEVVVDKSRLCFEYGCGEEKVVESEIVLGSSSETVPIVAYVDRTPAADPSSGVPEYEYDSSVVGDRHFGLGFDHCEEEEEEEVGVEGKVEEVAQGEAAQVGGLPSTPLPNNNNNNNNNKKKKKKKKKRNDGYISIGGVKLYTVDMSSEEEDEFGGFMDRKQVIDDDGSSNSDTGSCSDTSDECSDDGSTSDYDDDTDVDDDVMEDYLDGIGGASNLFRGGYLERNIVLSDDDENNYQNARKIGGTALMSASKMYGMKKKQQSDKSIGKNKTSGSPAEDFLSLESVDVSLSNKVNRGSMRKKKSKRFDQLSRSWPNDEHKSKRFKEIRGGKKKRRQEMIAVKRRQRMLNRGVDLEQINLTLRQMVIGGADMVAFPTMHSHDCSQVQRLASIYQLKSGCQGSGKKRFVVVNRTRQTCLPSSTDKIRLEKILYAGDEPEDSTVDSAPRGKNRTKTRETQMSAPTKLKKASRKYKDEDTQKSYASRPVSFIACGIMQDDSAEPMVVDSPEESSVEKTVERSVTMLSLSDNSADKSSLKVGAFEMHTRGFGSKMMAKMGFVEGAGLGKDGQGIVQPVEAIKRPKSLGLGIHFTEISESDEKTVERRMDKKPVNDLPKEARRKHTSARHCKNLGASSANNKIADKSQQVGAFEKHTKGFGSKMMTKMGFVPGMGLGKDAQGIVNPLTAVRRPKAMGLGAKG